MRDLGFLVIAVVCFAVDSWVDYCGLWSRLRLRLVLRVVLGDVC